MNNNFRNSMKYVMKLAWHFVKKYKYTMSEALKESWKNYRLRNMLHSLEAVKFVFKKKNGEIREAVGTLSSSILSAVPSDYIQKTPFGNQAFFDVEKNDWRSFKCETLMSIG